MKQKLSNLIYCARCRITTPHEVKGNDYTCGRCGSVKQAARTGSKRVERGADSHKSSGSVIDAGVEACRTEAHWN